MSQYTRQRTHSKTASQNTRKPRRQKEAGFFSRSLDYRNFVFAPEGFEGVMMAVYILAIPYLMGLVFLYFFVAEGQFEYFVEFSLASFFVIWAMGYEACAATLMAVIFISWFKHRNDEDDPRAKKKGSSPRFVG